MTALEVRGVSKAFGLVHALDGVTFDVATGRIAALLGPSGCGKTTLLRIIAGFERPDSGSVSIDGAPVTRPGVLVRPEHRSIGYVAQEGALFPHLTVAQNIAFALSVAERRQGARVARLLDLVSLDRSQLSRYPHELSGGQQQRVALARALARRPRLMLLDEPFAALDTSLRAETRNLMAAALAASDVTTVLVTHDQEEALSFADQIVVLRNGSVRQVGSPRDLYETPVDAWTAGFVGDAVLIPGRVADGWADTPIGRIPLAGDAPTRADSLASVLIRPEQVELTRPVGHTPGASDSPVVAGTVSTVSYRGHDTVATVTLNRRADVTVQCRILGDVDWIAPGVAVVVRVRGQGRLFTSPVDSAAASGYEAPRG
jgi:iron(III) transport system ATP-binding protein